MRQPSLVRGATHRRGVIDTFSAGYRIVNAHPWLLAAPLLLDSFLLLGPRLSIVELVAQWFAALDASPDLDQASRDMLVASQANAQEVLGSANLLTVLAVPRVGIPSALALTGGGGLAGDQVLQDWGAAFGLTLALLLVGLLAGGIFRAVIAGLVRREAGGPPTRPDVAAEGLRGAWRTLLLLLLVFGAVVLPAGIGGALLLALLPAGLVLPLMGVGLLWVQIHLFFALDAIFVRKVGALRAVRDSVGLVRGQFWPSMGFIVLTMLILAGMTQVWLFMAERGAAGTVLAMLGNAYIATGLTAASMLYYRERMPEPAPQPAAVPPLAGHVDDIG